MVSFIFCFLTMIGLRTKKTVEKEKEADQMSCCQNIKAYVGYTQNQEWYVVMVSNERIVCECHSQHSDFYMRPPFSLEQWQQRWKQCQQQFFHGQKMEVKWEQDISHVLLNKVFTTAKGEVYHRT